MDEPSKRRLPDKSIYIVVVFLVALVVLSSSVGAFYYSKYAQANQSNTTYQTELAAALGDYDALKGNYSESLSLYNQTFALLVGVLSVVNTTEPVYTQASMALSSLWTQYLSLKPPRSSLLSADFLLDFGNGTLRWYNDTAVQPGWNLYSATVVLTNGDMQATWYPAYQEHFVSGIDGVSNSNTMYWFLWTYNATAKWQSPQVGADDLPVYNGSVFAWTYCSETPSYAPACTP